MLKILCGHGGQCIWLGYCLCAACNDVRYITVRLGLVSTQTGSQQDKPTISLLIKSFLPTVIQHYFALPTQRFVLVFHSQPEDGWLTRPRLSCRIWKLIMQLGQPQPAFANRNESLVGCVIRHLMSRMWCG